MPGALSAALAAVNASFPIPASDLSDRNAGAMSVEDHIRSRGAPTVTNGHAAYHGENPAVPDFVAPRRKGDR